MRLKAVSAALAVLVLMACGTHTPPQPPQIVGFSVVVQDAETLQGVEGATVITSNGLTGTTNHDGWVNIETPTGALSFSVHRAEYEDFFGPAIHVTGNRTEWVQIKRIAPPPPPPPPPHPDPVVGAIRVLDGGRCFADDTGCRTFTVVHAGDLPLRWHAGGDAEVLADLDDMAREGYSVVRSWSHIKPSGNGVWARGGSPPYDGLDAIHKPDFIEREVALINAVAERGMRLTIEAGGIDGIGTADEQTLMRRFRAAIDAAGAWKVAWVAPVNEPSSVHGTSDDNGDVDPSYLRSLVRIMADGTGVGWHLGHAHNQAWDDPRERFAQKNFTAADQPFGYYHASREHHGDDKIRHRFSWIYEAPGHYKRLWVDGEGVGAPVCGGSLRCVSTTDNGHEMHDPELQALIVAMQSLRGIGSHMSGTGVQRYQPFTDSVGFREIPWTVRQLPRDVHTFDLITHGGRADAVIKAGHDQHGHLCRADQVVDGDGRVVAVLYVDADGPDNATCRFPVARPVSGTLIDPGAMSTSSVAAGNELVVDMRWGRVFSGR